MIKPSDLAQAEVVKLKKKHPCGGQEWRVLSVGMDCRLQCLTCGHAVILSRSELARRVVAVVKAKQAPQ